VTAHFSTDYYREFIDNIRNAVTERMQGEQAYRVVVETLETLENADPPALALREKLAAEQEQITQEFDRQKQQIEAQLNLEISTIEREYQDTTHNIKRQYDEKVRQIEQQHDDNHWMVTSIMDDSADDSPQRKYDEFKGQIERTKQDQQVSIEELESFNEQALTLIKKRHLFSTEYPLEHPEQVKGKGAIQEAFESCVASGRNSMEQLKKQTLPSLFAGWTPVWTFLLLWAISFGLAFLFLKPELLDVDAPPNDPAWLLILAGSSAAILIVVYVILYSIAGKMTIDEYHEIRQAIASAQYYNQVWLKTSKAEMAKKQTDFERNQARLEEKRAKALEKLTQTRSEYLNSVASERDAHLQVAQEKFPARISAIEMQLQQQTNELDRECSQQLTAVADKYHVEIRQSEQEHAQELLALRTQRDQVFEKMSSEWKESMGRLTKQWEELNQDNQQRFAKWGLLQGEQWQPPASIPDAIRIGEFNLDLSAIEDGISSNERLHLPQSQFALPLVLPFKESPSMLIKTKGIGRDAAVATLQTAMLRMMTLVPPGKLRFTVIDPLGLGENFSAFMHLADYDELLINNRIWTESTHIDQQLVNLTEQMENVFQMYLRSEFESLEEYNEYAGEVAEPYHVLVVANFPYNFSEAAARRLVSIANSGSRCGVHTLISVDTQQQMPHNFDLADLEHCAQTLMWDNERYELMEPELCDLPLTLDPPPGGEQLSEIVRTVGAASKDIRRVQVPFERVLPRNNQWWESNSKSGIDVPLGRSGATNLQYLRLGSGTSQHVLIAGKTGSGKSSFLHALITNIATHYSPNDIEFYLIDFKKGVEFKTYASHNFPHAKVIGIESDREFGVSALERLNEELNVRGELFRQHGVQDLQSYRESIPDAILPRIMLIVDEFQEYFTEDDRLSQNAALLLDRLVRQGRAFGVHVLLGSQTLAGAYTLARSTLGQMAVRVALQCSEADAHLILSEENTAARLLTRPGEAIYNDANGLVEGNHPFQIAWLGEEQRETFLHRFQQMAVDQNIPAKQTLVFEGNQPSEIAKNQQLTSLLSGSSAGHTAPATMPTLWWGEAVSIKDATSTRLQRQSGNNVMIVGQDREVGIGLLAATLLSTTAHNKSKTNADTANHPAKYVIFESQDQSDPDEHQLSQVSQTLPTPIENVTPKQTAEKVAVIYQELQERQNSDLTQFDPVYLFIVNLNQFRDLQKSEDDFGFGGMDKAEATDPAAQFQEILREGPALGFHTFCWADSYRTVDRWLGRNGVKDFDIRILMQMSGVDSSNLIDTAEATRLGQYRALLHSEITGESEKFRPYGMPSLEWMRQQFQTTDIIDDQQEQKEHGRKPDAEPTGDETNSADLTPEDLEDFTVV